MTQAALAFELELEELELELELELGVGTPIPLLELDCVGITPLRTVEVETADEDDVRGVVSFVMCYPGFRPAG